MFLFVIGCATTETGSLEAARFALDKGNYSKAITEATEALSANPDNYDAARILASAYLGRSGIDYLDLAEGALDLANNDDVSNFQQIADVLPETADVDDLRSAIETLEALDGIDATSFTDDVLADCAFDSGLMQLIEQFALGVYGSDYFGTFDVEGITATDRGNVLTDLIRFDNRLIAAGVDSTEDWLEEVRQTFCILEPISAGEGFTLAEYQAFVGCELDENPDTFDTASLTADIATCDDVNPENQGAAVQACYSQNTSL